MWITETIQELPIHHQLSGKTRNGGLLKEAG
jgi:hypothetical protein